MKYFEKFPLINYPYKGKLVNSENAILDFLTTIDLNVRFSIIDSVYNSRSAFYTYSWQDGDTPDIIAYHYYGDHYYDWVVMISAQAFDWLYDFPMNDDLLEDFIVEKYNIDFLESFSTIHHYEDKDGFVIDYTQYVIEPEPKKIVYIFDYEKAQNELKREIKLISKELLSRIDDELNKKLTDIRNLRETYGNG